jgi:phosphopantothenoylcysteine synthetase/decarboxylase
MNEPTSAGRVLYLVVCAAPPAQRIDELISLLMQQGWSICVIPTPRAAGWLDISLLTAQTGFSVRHEYRQPSDPSPLPKADAILVAPATFNTINKWVAGISDTFALGILNEAIGLPLPVIVVPYAKSTLAAHPAFKKNRRRLKRWGVHILANEVIGRRPAVPSTSAGFDWSPVVDAVTNL